MAIAWKHSNLCILGMAYKWVHSGYEDCSQKNFSTIVEASPIPSTISFSREKFTIFFWFWKKTDPPKLYIFSWYNSSYKPQIQSCHQYHQNDSKNFLLIFHFVASHLWTLSTVSWSTSKSDCKISARRMKSASWGVCVGINSTNESIQSFFNSSYIVKIAKFSLNKSSSEKNLILIESSNQFTISISSSSIQMGWFWCK